MSGGMDSIDDSLLTQIVLRLADHTDRFRENWHVAIISSLFFTFYYALFGHRRDVAFIAVAGVLAVSSETRQHVCASGKPPMFNSALVAVCSVIFLRFMTFTTSNLLLRGVNTLSTHAWIESAGAVFIPSRTTHSRFFPKKHSFAYSYLTVGIPVGLRSEINGLLSVDPPQPPAPTRSRWWWWWWWWWQWLSRLVSSSPVYKVDAANHLARGIDQGGLRAKLNHFLASQKINANNYPYAFLVTAPQFLGYSFNPVSFWYLYSPAKVLSAMILEVNNTFDERRPYLVFRDFEQEETMEKKKQADASTATVTATTTTISRNGTSKVPRISASFDKDFHVSPFNSRKGSYSPFK
ncbi:hypothetical protein NQ176_g10436 [Zarea fungicola]|uniref:Uncharacterized protein n=1 Tax=Zarea fungicola TaxID=93591 RepID=A0ACC1MG48_9HYPO|nr:hypothetical protein NQ176_g10436 [Lecanicillium fungicola]